MFSRRSFLKLSAAGMAVPLLQCRDQPLRMDFPVEIIDDLVRAHTIFEGPPPAPPQGEETVDVLVVGAGIAGLAAAAGLQGRNVVVCEVGRTAGGSSSAHEIGGMRFAQGAHYDLAYPKNYGQEAIQFLESLDIVAYNGTTEHYEFVDKQYLIPLEHETRTWNGQGYQDDPIPNTPNGARLRAYFRDFEGKLPLPTRVIPQEYRAYNGISFLEWVQRMDLADDPRLVAALDYQCRDDYGAGCAEVSALAGLSYYACRAYYSRDILHFSPPQGNAYFIDKLLAQLPPESLRLSHVVASVETDAKSFVVDAIDLEARRFKRFRARQVVYAGQKHALKRIYPTDAPIFAQNRYAPWITFNLVLNQTPREVYWQNEVLGVDPALQGFVNSRAQTGEGPVVLTAYMCTTAEERASMLQHQHIAEVWLPRVLHHINASLGQRIDEWVERVVVKPHGHAMAIPSPGHLFQDGNERRSQANLVYAGCDNGRLPLMLEALDSGILAAKALTQG